MQTKYKRHDKVKLLADPNPEYVEFHTELEGEEVTIKKGMPGEINMLLSNGKYHVGIKDKKENTIAYCEVDEDQIEKR
jgi:hypothetical protein